MTRSYIPVSLAGFPQLDQFAILQSLASQAALQRVGNLRYVSLLLGKV